MFKKIVAGLCLAALIGPAFAEEARPVKNKTVILATTTSVQDTGLLDVLIAAFQKKSGYLVKAIAVGSGQAMQLGKTGEADLLWVHSPDDEKQFVAEGYGTDRTTFMYNDFVVLGPASDPAKIKSETPLPSFCSVINSPSQTRIIEPATITKTLAIIPLKVSGANTP